MLYKNHTINLLILFFICFSPSYAQFIEDEKIPALLSENPVDSYLLKLVSSLRYFQRYRFKIDDSLTQGNLEPIYDIFRIYRLRVQQRLGFSLKTLLNYNKNFESDSSYDFNNNSKNWLEDIEQLESLWQKKTYNDLLTLILAGQTKEIATDVLEKRYKRFVKKINLFNEEDVISIFLNAYAHTLDPHSNYLNPTQSEEYEIQMSLSSKNKFR